MSTPRPTTVVLDDDPTGTQTVHDTPVLLRWDQDAIAGLLADPATPVFYILTNSRALLEPDALAEDTYNAAQGRLHVTTMPQSWRRTTIEVDGARVLRLARKHLPNAKLVVLEANIDDMDPRIYGEVSAQLFEAGALDVALLPLQMKKGRPGVALTVLCHPDQLGDLQAMVFAETGTLGLRVRATDKHMVERRFEQVTVRGHRIAIKVGPHGFKPEHDDLVDAADELGLPLHQLAAEAMAAHAASTPDRASD